MVNARDVLKRIRYVVFAERIETFALRIWNFEFLIFTLSLAYLIEEVIVGSQTAAGC